ncbi:hypothetical protein V7I88_004571 [Salmonella enterica]
MTKLYKAVDKMDGKLSAFLLRDDGKVCKSFWDESDDKEIKMAKACGHLQGSCSNGMADAINPVLVAEW